MIIHSTPEILTPTLFSDFKNSPPPSPENLSPLSKPTELCCEKLLLLNEKIPFTVVMSDVGNETGEAENYQIIYRNLL